MVFIELSNAINTMNLRTIVLTFLVPGHSQNENDTAHSCIERQYRKKVIYTTAQWETTIRDAFVTNACEVKTLMHDDIEDYKSTEAFPQYTTVLKDKCMEYVDTEIQSDTNGKKTLNEVNAEVKRDKNSRRKEKDQMKADKNGKRKKSGIKANKVMWKSIVQIKFTKDASSQIFFKYDYNENYRIADFMDKVPQTRNRKTKAKGALYPKYDAPVGINVNKKKDLLKLCKDGLIPKAHHSFYADLTVNGGENDNKELPEINSYGEEE